MERRRCRVRYREGGRGPDTAIAVAVLADDPIVREGAAARLSTYREIAVLGMAEQRRAEALLVLADEVTEDLLGRMERAYREVRDRDLSVVLVADQVGDSHVLRAVGAGLVCLLRRREVGYDRIVRAVVAAHAGRAELPDTTQRLLVDRFRALQRDVLGPLDLTMSGLAAREVEVLRLFAEGLDTGEVAAKLNHSERTVKYIVHGVLSRLKLRNRTQAVAFALRSGAL